MRGESMKTSYSLYFHWQLKSEIISLYDLYYEYKHCIWFSVSIIPHFYFLSVTKETSCCWGVLLVAIALATATLFCWDSWCCWAGLTKRILRCQWILFPTNHTADCRFSTKSSSVTIFRKIPHKSNCLLFLPLHCQVTFEAFRVKFCLAGNLKYQTFQCSTFLQNRTLSSLMDVSS